MMYDVKALTRTSLILVIYELLLLSFVRNLEIRPFSTVELVPSWTALPEKEEQETQEARNRNQNQEQGTLELESKPSQSTHLAKE